MTNRTFADVAVKTGATAIVALAGAAQAQDLEGLYGGLSYTRGSGEIDDGGSVYSFDGSANGAFVGYNHVVGDWLFGAELAFSNGDYLNLADGSSPYISASNVRDIKARVGRSFGRTLVYGVVGHSSFDFAIVSSPTEHSDGTATAIGLGFETAIGAKGFIGGEYLVRRDLNLSGSQATPYSAAGSELNTISLRAGLRF